MTRPNSPCIEHLGGDQYRCTTRGWVFKTDTLPIRCGCTSAAKPPPAPRRPQDTMADRYAKIAHNGPHEVSLETLLARVDKCVTMSCEHFDEELNLCVCYQGSPCKRGQWWFTMLMSPQGCKLQEADHVPSP